MTIKIIQIIDRKHKNSNGEDEYTMFGLAEDGALYILMVPKGEWMLVAESPTEEN